jgi:fructokinase
LGQRELVSRQFIQQFVQSITAPDVLKVYDPNLRSKIDVPTKEIIHQSLQLANTVKLSHDEVDNIGKAFEYFSPINKPGENKGEQKDYDERSRVLFEKHPNINILIITLSTRGSYIYTRKGDFSFMKAEVVEDAKPVGCGDSFLAGVIASLVSGKDLVYAHEKGTAVSRFVAQNDSATPELPEELRIK